MRVGTRRRFARLTYVTSGLCVLLSACASVTPPPPVTRSTTQVERRSIYEKYRLDPFDDQTVIRDADRLSLGQVRRLSETCPGARDLIEPEPAAPIVLGLIGGGLMGYGLAGFIFPKGDDPLTSEDTDAIILGVGGGIAALALFLDYALEPRAPHMSRVTDAYNACLKRDLLLTPRPDREAETPEVLPWRNPVDDGKPSETATSETSTIAGHR